MNNYLITRKEAEDMINALITTAWLLSLVSATRIYINSSTPSPMAMFAGVFSMIALIMKPDVKIIRRD